MKAGRIALIVAALAALGLSAWNASWLAAKPQGRLTLLARHGIALPYDASAQGCTAAAIDPIDHSIVENSFYGFRSAISMGADGFALDVHATADGRAVVFRDSTLDCRTDGTGPIAERTLEELQRLDIGYGYTADGGATFPLRGRGVGGMLALEAVLKDFSASPLLLVLHGPAAADAVLGEFERAGIEIGEKHGFAGDAAALARLRARTRAGWIIDKTASDACLDAYAATGWTGVVPDSCRETMLSLPIEGRSFWTVWGWPYRFLDRMADADTRMLVLSRYRGDAPVGLTEPEQLGEVPRHYKGLLLVEDMYRAGRALVR